LQNFKISDIQPKIKNASPNGIKRPYFKIKKIKVNIKTLLENNEKYSSINNYNKLICLFSE
jgi:hypothetical protein